MSEKELDSGNFNEEINNTEKLVLVDFYATWCGPCMMLAPVLDEISNSRAGYNILIVDVDENPNISNELKIDTIPTICIYKDGELMEKQVGFRNKDEIIELIEKYQ